MSKWQFMCRKAIHFLTFLRKISVCLILQGEYEDFPKENLPKLFSLISYLFSKTKQAFGIPESLLIVFLYYSSFFLGCKNTADGGIDVFLGNFARLDG